MRYSSQFHIYIDLLCVTSIAKLKTNKGQVYQSSGTRLL